VPCGAVSCRGGVVLLSLSVPPTEYIYIYVFIYVVVTLGNDSGNLVSTAVLVRGFSQEFYNLFPRSTPAEYTLYMTIWCVGAPGRSREAIRCAMFTWPALHRATVEAWRTAAASERITAGLHELFSDPRNAAAGRHGEGWPVGMLTAEVKPRHA
jgi:hypothetical protein